MKKLSPPERSALLILLAFAFLALFIPGGPVVATGSESLPAATSEPPGAKIESSVQRDLAALPEGDVTTVIVTLRSQADFTHVVARTRGARLSQVVRTLQEHANATQNRLLSLLRTRQEEGQVIAYEPYWVFNGLAVTATAMVIEELAARPEVARITPNKIYVQPTALNSPEDNIAVVNAPALWDLGVQGQGIVVANMDTGVYKDHPDLIGRWRGGTNSWFDPYGEHPSAPIDLNGHGTWTMGVMVGGDAGGTAIGMAPGAQWIAVKIFDDSGASTAAAIHAGYQWLLDPDGDPATADAPHVVNNSWTFSTAGCNMEFEQDLLSLRAAGILPIFAAGNAGPGSDTSRSPANNPAAFAVGATDNSDLLSFESSRGPSSCDAESFYPELVAPGVAIRTADSYGFYYSPSGTSLAAPHVAGALALFLSSYPDLTTSAQAGSLINTAVDLGAGGPDNDYGYGRLDVLAAYQALQAGAPPTPTPVPSENLALGKPVNVSSYEDSSHNGAKAVDGDPDTYWQTKRVRGRNASSDEWIVVDLGSLSTIDEITITWHDYFAIAYQIELSDSGNDWITAYSTSGGDGGVDTVSLGGALARYVRVASSAWSDSSLRSWMRELEVLGIPGSPEPTATPAPTPTPPPAEPGTIHVGDLDASTRNMGQNWSVAVTVSLHDGSEEPVAGAVVSGMWSAPLVTPDSCTTDENGRCSLSSNRIDGQHGSVTFAVESITGAGYSYEPADNHDSDADSDGNAIIVTQP